MRAPHFWWKDDVRGALLAPLGWVWQAGSAGRGLLTHPYEASVPVICIGNVVVGGAGKTPTALSVAHRLAGAHFLSRGYGGSTRGPLRVDPARHDHLLVGDEPLLLAETAPCWVAEDRAAGARAAEAAGARCLVMDDGFQNPTLKKSLSLLVVDGHAGFGNGRCLPAGPLREPVERALLRADAVVLLGEDRTGVAARVRNRPLLHAVLEPEAEATALKGQPVVAFAGIGRPEKFFASLEKLGAKVVEAYAFPDHYRYQAPEIGQLVTTAANRSAALITTTKDYVRIPPHQRGAIGVLRMTVTWADETALMRILATVASIKEDR